MTDRADRDSEIERICQAALDCLAADRAALLRRECGGDETMRREVEGLLAFEASAERFLETAANAQVLAVPSRIGPYNIVAILGTGGMGDVYRARDTVLGRDVALKVLPPALAADPERFARFQREAKVLASLNHPNIAQIYGVEQGALVMELVEGETLQAPLPIDTTLDYAGQIAAALEAAHEKGVVHRDLKPANVMTTAQGAVKVLDFGLAAMEGELGDAAKAADEPTGPLHATRAGAIMGTAAYMSPEQATGRPVDKRTDIWSFGVVLWELLTGRRLFEADSVSQTLAMVTTAPIDLERLPRETPAGIRELLSRCLDRDVKTRLRDIGEARILIQRCLTATPPVPAAFSRHRVARATTRATSWISAGLAVVFALLFAIERRGARDPGPSLPLTFQIAAPPHTTIVSGPALSPDGRHVAFTARSADGRVRIWVHALDSGKAHLLAGTEDAFSPLFWSPDNRYVGFATPMTLSKVGVAGGPPVTLCDRCGPATIGSRVFRGGSWNSSGVIVYAISSNGLWRVPESGGTPVRVTPAGDYGYPAFLPDGVHLLYTWFGRQPQPGVYLGDLREHEERPSKRLIDGAFVLSSYVSRDGANGGYLLALREGVLTSRPFDPITATASGEPVVIAENVPTVEPPGAFSASSTSALSFTTSTSADRSRLVWFDRRGNALGHVGPPSYGSNISISPDGNHIAFDSIESDRRTRHIWTTDPTRGVVTVVNAGPRDATPVTASDGTLALASPADIFLTRSSSLRPPDALYRSPNPKVPNDWSADGRFLTFNELHPTRRSDLYVLDVGRRQSVPLVVTEADELPAVFSPDGKWIAYSSDETGSREVYVRDFAPDRVPAVGVIKIRVSPDGGDKPRWRRDGTELYYIAADARLMAVPVRRTPTFNVGAPVALFELRFRKAGTFFPYDVTNDGRFLVDTLDGPSSDGPGGMTVVLNWMRR
jgi:serine/threonine protein kinase/Tol biopolymer transport system component